jgi:hypothetical protein
VPGALGKPATAELLCVQNFICKGCSVLFVVLAFELRALLAREVLYHLTHTSSFVMFFKTIRIVTVGQMRTLFV